MVKIVVGSRLWIKSKCMPRSSNVGTGCTEAAHGPQSGRAAYSTRHREMAEESVRAGMRKGPVRLEVGLWRPKRLPGDRGDETGESLRSPIVSTPMCP